jgi:hypothetical protein
MQLEPLNHRFHGRRFRKNGQVEKALREFDSISAPTEFLI